MAVTATVRKRTWVGPTGKPGQAWVVAYTDPKTGKRVEKQRKKKADAEALRQKVESQLVQGVHIAGKAPTVGEAADAYLTEFEELVEAEKRERSTLRGYRIHYRLHLLQHQIATRMLSELTGPDCVEFARWLESTRSDDMSKRVMFLLRTVLDYATGKGWIGHNPAASVKLVKAGDRFTADDDEVEIPPKDQLKALIEAAQETGRMEDALVRILMFCGLRISEARGLHTKRLDLKVGKVLVRERADRWNKIGPPKSKTSRRDVPVPPATAAALKLWLGEIKMGGLVFPTGTGTPWLYGNLYNRVWLPLMAKAELLDAEGKPLFGFHTLRHVAVSLWIEQGLKPKRVSKLAGHSSVQFTMDVYGHLWPEDDEDQVMASKMEQSLG
ncbi:MAG TPA: site-specific integrase [Alcanivorax sp.]|nr:site-specific integrase [Alcanivorax sp.]